MCTVVGIARHNGEPGRAKPVISRAATIDVRARSLDRCRSPAAVKIEILFANEWVPRL
jgi:hypothetical protein